MEFVQFHPTGMVHPPGVRGLLVTEAVRGEGGILRNADGERFMWRYLPEDRRHEYAATDEEARAWVDALTEGRVDRPSSTAGAVHARQRRARHLHGGQGGPRLAARRRLPGHQLPARRSACARKLPSMYEQFKELADVDITAGPMEVGPTMHYMMGGIRVDADTGATTMPGLYAAGEVAAGLHGSNRLGGNSLTDLLVFGRRAGEAAVEATAAGARTRGPPADLPSDFVDESLAAMALPFERRGEDPNRLHADLKETMSSLVGIFRTEADLRTAIARLEGYKERWHGLAVTGPRRFNPGWDLVFELRNMLAVSEAIARSALERTESRGAHSRLDFVGMRPEWDVVNVTVGRDGRRHDRPAGPHPRLPAELRQYVTAGADAAKD